LKRIVFLIPALALAVSCASLKAEKPLLTDPSARQAIAPFSLNLGFDRYMLRLDLRRGTHETMVRNSRNEERTVEVQNPYHPVVVDLGNGLILDFNNNLCIDLARAYGLVGLNKFRVEVEGDLFGDVPSEVSKDGVSYRVARRSGIETGTVTATMSADDEENHNIQIYENRLEDTLKALGGIIFTVPVNKRPRDRIMAPSTFGEKTIAALEEGSLRTADRAEIKHLGDRIEFGGNTLIHTGRSMSSSTAGTTASSSGGMETRYGTWPTAGWCAPTAYPASSDGAPGLRR
jgi:hypothetical protein